MGRESLYQEELILEKHPAELCQIKDYAVLMEMAGSYLCEDEILSKFADGIEENLESLKDYVYRVRRKFIGKPIHEIDIIRPYNGIKELAASLRRLDETTKERFKEGRLGAAMMQATREMATALEELVDRVQGKTDRYRKRDLLLQVYYKIKLFGHSVITTYKVLTKLTLTVIAAGLIAFAILLATMDTEKDILVQVGNTKTAIEKKQDVLEKISKLISETLQQVQALEQKRAELGREDKIKLIKFKLREHTLKQKKEKIQIEIQREKKILDKELKRLEEIRNSSFFERLLRNS